MSWKQSVPIGVGVFLSVIAAGVIGAAMFLTDNGEEALHLYKNYQAASNPGVPMGPKLSRAMELQGKWCGINIVDPKSPTAQRMSLGEVEGGVVVAGLHPTNGAIAKQSGVLPGDVIVGVDKAPIKDMTDMFNVSRNLPPVSPVLLDVRRQGHPMTLVIPAAAFSQPRATGEGEAVPAAWTGQQYYCPRDGLTLPRGMVRSPLVCPRCQGPLHLFQPGRGGVQGRGGIR